MDGKANLPCCDLSRLEQMRALACGAALAVLDRPL
ncbi:MAG: hypothetical protein KatS3mg058_2924 [Roseiflexus sp.]|jgi:hypothetical protein|nr:MAG: hypothetical protein KatS3mg058_2924 [Roseiflexus sp.]